jgi:ABC-2 type transport system ATP-binding protein
MQDARLAALVKAKGGSTRSEPDGALAVTGLDAAAIGDLAGTNGITLHELSPQEASLEEAYMELTHDSVEYRTGGSAAPTPAGKVA